MQQNSDGNKKQPIHTIFKKPLHDFDLVKTTKTLLKNIIRPVEEINNNM